MPYAHLSNIANEDANKGLLGKLAVLKLNGGLGTTMGCIGPKSAIEVRDGLTFLDLTVRQIQVLSRFCSYWCLISLSLFQYLNQKHDVGVPLILMNSFNTDSETSKIIQKYSGHGVSIKTFNQSRFPRILKESLTPMPSSYDSNIGLVRFSLDFNYNLIHQWYPPGHGDLFESLNNSGVLDQLLAEGKEYLFVSNVDNLGATVDTSKSPFENTRFTHLIRNPSTHDGYQLRVHHGSHRQNHGRHQGWNFD